MAESTGTALRRGGEQGAGVNPFLVLLVLASIAIIVTAAIVAQLVDRTGPKPMLVAGLLVLAAGLIWFSRMTVDGSYAMNVLLPGTVMAVGLGMTFVPLTISGVSGVPPEEAGLASGLLNTSQQVGGALGLAVLSTVATTRTESVLEGLRRIPTPADLLDALTHGYSAALLVGSLFAIAGIVVALALIRADRSESPQVSQVSEVSEVSEISEGEEAVAAASVG